MKTHNCTSDIVSITNMHSHAYEGMYVCELIIAIIFSYCICTYVAS